MAVLIFIYGCFLNSRITVLEPCMKVSCPPSAPLLSLARTLSRFLQTRDIHLSTARPCWLLTTPSPIDLENHLHFDKKIRYIAQNAIAIPFVSNEIRTGESRDRRRYLPWKSEVVVHVSGEAIGWQLERRKNFALQMKKNTLDF